MSRIVRAFHVFALCILWYMEKGIVYVAQKHNTMEQRKLYETNHGELL